MPDMEQLYAQRLNRYVTAMRNGTPDRVPIRPFAAEFTAKYAGYTDQEVTHDYERAFAAVRKCAADFDWDAAVGNMVYVWTGLTEAIGLKYYGVPGIAVPPDTGFQYREPAEEQANMLPEEYDHLIEDPTGFLYNIWLPRVSRDVVAPGRPNTFRNNLSFVKGGMAMLNYFMGFGTQGALLRSQSGTVSAISGIFKAPFDIIADKLRGYLGLTYDVMERPEKVLAACEALMPHLLAVALGGADPEKNVPIGFWMHRGCVPFISQDQFDTFYWPTLKPIIERIWAAGHQTLFYAEGNWDAHLQTFNELPEQSLIFHIDKTNPELAHKILGEKFSLSGGVPNYLLSYGAEQEVKDYCKRLIDNCAGDGGYIMDASAIIQDDARVENVRAMTDFTREYGVYSTSKPAKKPNPPEPITPMPGRTTKLNPGVCIPWEHKVKELPAITGDESILRNIWENVDLLGYTYIWQILLSF